MVNWQALRELRQDLLQPPQITVDDGLLAEMVTAELSGEDVDALYPAEMRQIENDVDLADAYGELMRMMATAVADMSATAQAVSPREVYLHLLAQQAELPPEAQAVLATVVDRLAVLGADGEATAVAHAISPVPAQWQAKVKQAIEQTGTALALYLRGQADALWQKLYRVTAQTTGKGVQLQFGLATPTGTLLHGEEIGDSRTVFRQMVGEPLPSLVTVKMERDPELPLLCRLLIQVDRPDLLDPSGQVVEIRYGDEVVTAVTDEKGVVVTAVGISVLREATIKYH